MKYVAGPPTVDGFYWYRAPQAPPISDSDKCLKHDEPTVLSVSIEYGEAYQTGSDWGFPLTDLHGEWQGPLTPTN